MDEATPVSFTPVYSLSLKLLAFDEIKVRGGLSPTQEEWFLSKIDGRICLEVWLKFPVKEIDFESSFAELSNEGHFSDESHINFYPPNLSFVVV